MDNGFCCGCCDRHEIAAGRRYLSVAFIAAFLGYAAAAFLFLFPTSQARLAGDNPAVMIEFAAEQNSNGEAGQNAESQPISESNAYKENTAAEASSEKHIFEKNPSPAAFSPEQTGQAEQPIIKANPQKEISAQSAVAKPKKAQKADTQQKAAAKNSVQERKLQPQAKIAAAGAASTAIKSGGGAIGQNGTSDPAWEDLVYRKIQSIAKRMQRQLPNGKGVAYISLRYDAAGKIMAVRLASSSGNSVLDALAIRIVDAASPLPQARQAGEKTIPIRVH